MALRLMPRSPRRRIRLVPVIGGLKVLSRPVGLTKTSADLTPATGARTTRFCRTLRRRSSCARDTAHGINPPCNSRITRTRPRPPHPVPTCVTMANAPPPGQDGEAYSSDLPDGLSGIFLQRGLDRANHVERFREIRRSAQPAGWVERSEEPPDDG